jgi:hypothetical protein
MGIYLNFMNFPWHQTKGLDVSSIWLDHGNHQPVQEELNIVGPTMQIKLKELVGILGDIDINISVYYVCI